MAKILLIDDEEGMRRWTSHFLNTSGHDAFTAADGQPGIELAREIKFDLVITDIIMPDKEGLETIMELKKEYPDLPIVAMSGGGHMRSEDILEMALSLGAVDTLQKPFTGDDLLEMIDRCLNPVSAL
jgi:DNA-binding response OmpR family regulator